MTYYPINDFGPAMKGMVIGGLGIFHVYLAQFAIGGGLLMTYFQWLGMRGENPSGHAARAFVDGLFRVLVLVSFVTGALTGVAMWFTTIQVSPRTIGVMVDEFHWIWAVEWTFFCLEVAAGYAFYRYGKRLPDFTRLLLLALYSLAAWMSLFWINGILSWQLTPGGFLPAALTGEETQAGTLWSGFFNATFWPSLFFRTISSMATAALAAALVANLAPGWSRRDRRTVIRHAFHFLVPMVVMPLLGVWYMAAMPADSRGWAMGGSIAMTLFFSIGVGASLLIGAYAVTVWFSPRLTVNGSTSALLLLLGFSATAGAEFVREGVRKPYTVRGALYSNSIAQSEVKHLRRVGCATKDPYPLADGVTYPNQRLQRGAKVFRAQCSVCHTWDGANGVAHLAETWTTGQLRQNLAQLQRTKPYMPPFAGTADEVEALVQWIQWRHASEPADWDAEPTPATLQRIQQYLDEAGTDSAIKLTQSHD